MPDTAAAKIWAPEQLSESGLTTLATLLKIAADKGMISAKDATHGLTILSTNPARQLARLGQRLALLSQAIKAREDADLTLAHALERIESDHAELTHLVTLHIEWSLTLTQALTESEPDNAS